jgi:hypothetical protein
MPQFDTVSFFSQIFWVLLFFTLLYLSLTYYLLPAIATTLKVRKRKLSVQGATGESVALTGSSASFSNQLQTFTSLVNNELLESKTRFETSTSTSAASPLPITDFLIINECNKAFSSKFYSCFFNISLFVKK